MFNVYILGLDNLKKFNQSYRWVTFIFDIYGFTSSDEVLDDDVAGLPYPVSTILGLNQDSRIPEELGKNYLET